MEVHSYMGLVVDAGCQPAPQLGLLIRTPTCGHSIGFVGSIPTGGWILGHSAKRQEVEAASFLRPGPRNWHGLFMRLIKPSES